MHRLATSFSRHYVQRSVQFGKYLNNYSRFFSSKANPLSETYISGSNCHYIEEFYTQWKQDPTSVEQSWAEFFQSVDELKPHGEALPPPTRLSKFAGTTGSPYDWSAVDTLKIFNIIRSYRVLGHFMADLDPLGLEKASFSKIKEDYKKELLPASYGFTEADMDREFFVGEELVLAPGKKSATLREIINHLQKVYCGTIGVQFMHVQDPAVKDWVRDKFESNDIFKASKEDKKKIFKELLEAEEFENFCQHQFKVKRFGLNGGESLIPGMHALLESVADYGIENVVIGMPHRGRLNVMANIMGKPLIQIFNEFQIDTIHGKELAASVLGTGDVKYHLGTSHDRIIKEKKVHLSMAANPSHLEAVNPVVVGKTRAKQTDKEGKINYNKAIGILIHGDAAFAGQGIVGETIELSGLDDFTTGGTIHIIVNNQIGFTTVPKYARTSPYPSEIAKAAGSPIFHVNGDHPESVAAVFKLAAEFRQKFNRDTVIDIYCYRRHGHNEFDEPRFTQPKMYQKIAEHPTVATIYRSKLLKEHTITEQEANKAKESVVAVLNEGYQKRDQYKSIT